VAKAKKTAAPLDLDQFFSPPDQTADLDFLLGGEPAQTAERARERGLPLLDLSLTAIAPDPQQVRRLPAPADLLGMEAAGDRAAAAILTGLRELGQSMVEHGQVQPAIVYPDTELHNPAITHRLLHGQRRWSAAVLMDMPALWVVEVPKPTDVTRLLRQFEENERREGLSDMERAWSLIMLKDAVQKEAGGDVPWSVVEEQLQISDARRHDLLRLLRFSPEGQAIVLRYGWSEWALRPLHMAINAGAIDQDIATELMRELANAGEVSASFVADVVEEYQRQHTRTADGAVGPSRRDGGSGSSAPPIVRADVVRTVARMRRSVAQVQRQIPSVTDNATRAALLQEIEGLLSSLQTLLLDLTGNQ
jgi:ParB/Sulfiredoxin domain